MAQKRNRSNFTRFFQELREDVQKNAIKALDKWADLVVDEADRRAPKLTRKLANSIHKITLNSGRRIKIVADAKSSKGVAYGQFAEFDPGFSKDGPKPFMHPAQKAKYQEGKEKVIDAIRGAIKKNAKS